MVRLNASASAPSFHSFKWLRLQLYRRAICCSFTVIIVIVIVISHGVVHLDGCVRFLQRFRATRWVQHIGNTTGTW